MFDPFENIEVSFAGTEPEGRVEIHQKDTSGMYAELGYVTYENGIFSNGDVVKVYLTAWDDPVTYCAENYGVCPTAIEKEYVFYTSSRGSDIGLSRYDAVMPISDEQKHRAVDILVDRLGYTPDVSFDDLARGLYAVGESGWDINPRMTYHAYDFAVTDLNSLIYSIEDNMEFFATEFEDFVSAEKWRGLKEKRAALLRQYLKADDGIFYDYDLVKKERTSLFSAACYYPLYFGIASADEAAAAVKKLPLLETEWGIVTSVKCDEIKGTFQWGYPNGWPPMQQIVVGGLIRYGYFDDAKRIASKFLSLVEKCFAQTGHLWEKYDVVLGSADALAEYETPAMLGWTYGTYRVFSSLLHENE